MLSIRSLLLILLISALLFATLRGAMASLLGAQLGLLSAIPVGVLTSLTLLGLQRRLVSIALTPLLTTLAWDLVLGFAYLHSSQIADHIDPTREISSPEVWLYFIVPFHLVCVAIFSFTLTLLLKLLSYRRSSSQENAMDFKSAPTSNAELTSTP